MSNKDEQLSFLTEDENPEQTLENCHRFLYLFLYLDHSQPINDYAGAAIVMILAEVSNALTELGDTYNFVEKSGNVSAIG